MEKDWRLGRGQEDYLKGKTLIWKKFKAKPSKTNPSVMWDHEHCEFCWHKIMENCEDPEDYSTEGYCTADERTWICETCYNDFKETFKWTLVNK